MATNTTKKTTRCNCSTWEFGSYGPTGDASDYDSYTTNCVETTARTFAMGHDAKLVGFMVRAEMAGEDISRDQGGMRVTYSGAVQAAATISEALAAKAQAQLDAAKARIAKKAAREATKTARKSAKAAAPAPTTRTATIKIGRWTYEATITLATGEAAFTTAKGEAKTAAAGKFTEIN